MFNSYQEIEMKYNTLLANLRSKEEDESRQHNSIGKLRSHNEDLLTQVTEAERQLVLAREVVEERNREV